MITFVSILRHIHAQPGGIANIDSFAQTFGYVPQNHLDELVEQKLIDHQLEYANGEFIIVSYSLTALGEDRLSRLHSKVRANHKATAAKNAESRRAAAERAADRSANRFQFWITTAIAFASLVKSFWPELTTLWAWLWK